DGPVMALDGSGDGHLLHQQGHHRSVALPGNRGRGRHHLDDAHGERDRVDARARPGCHRVRIRPRRATDGALRTRVAADLRRSRHATFDVLLRRLVRLVWLVGVWIYVWWL